MAVEQHSGVHDGLNSLSTRLKGCLRLCFCHCLCWILALQTELGCAQNMWRWTQEGYLREILTARVYDVAVSSITAVAASTSRVQQLLQPGRAQAATGAHAQHNCACFGVCCCLVLMVDGLLCSCMPCLVQQLPSHVVCCHVPLQVQSPLDKAEKLSEALGNNLLLKREDLQPVSTASTPFA